MLESVVDRVVAYCSREDTRAMLEDKVLRPLVRWAAERLRWCAWVAQAVLALVAVQTAILVWLLVRELRRA